MGDLPGVFLQGDRICSGAVNIGQPEFVFLSLQQKKPSSLSLSGNRRRRHINSALPLLLLQKAASRSQLPAFDPVNVLPCNGGTPVLTTGKRSPELLTGEGIWNLLPPSINGGSLETD